MQLAASGLTASQKNEDDSMTKKKPPDQATSFADAMSGQEDVERLDREKIAKQPPPAGSQRSTSVAATESASRTASQSAASKSSGPNWNAGTTLVAASRAEMKRLRAGKVRPQQTIDLHGFTLDRAYQHLCNEIARATTAGYRCVLVIHGKGQHSTAGALTIKEALAEWLGEPPLVQRIRGRTLAQPKDGGAGASYLLLR